MKQKVLFVSNSPQRCGVHQFGKSTAQALASAPQYQFCYVECPSDDKGVVEFFSALNKFCPKIIIYNWHQMTMPWLTDEILGQVERKLPGLKNLAIVHDYCAPLKMIDAFIHIDPTFTEIKPHYRIGRLIPEYAPQIAPPANIIGSFGFGSKHKNYFRIVEQVNQEFDQATIRLHIPYSDYGDQQGIQARKLVEECRTLCKPGVTLEVSHAFMDQKGLLDWLAGNSINCFFFDKCEGSGISSSIELALAVKRPIAITDSYMFRHIIHSVPTINIALSCLKQIIANGTKPLESYYHQWTKENLIKDYERIMNEVLSNPIYDLTSNRVLTEEDRTNLRPVIKELTQLCPDIMQMKIPEAVFQNAFIFQQAKNLAKKTDHIILIGGYNDPIGPALQKLGYQVKITDPSLDKKDMEEVWKESILFSVQYDLVICCSVLEHVQDDLLFVKQMFQILKPGGHAILTTDYCVDWDESKQKPSSDVRMYTPERLQSLIQQLPAESILDKPTWGPIEPYFTIESVKYAFCSLAFQKQLTHTPDNELARDYLYKQYKEKIEELSQLKNHLTQFQNVEPLALAIARKFQTFFTRYPSVSKILNKMIKTQVAQEKL